MQSIDEIEWKRKGMELTLRNVEAEMVMVTGMLSKIPCTKIRNRGSWAFTQTG